MFNPARPDDRGVPIVSFPELLSMLRDLADHRGSTPARVHDLHRNLRYQRQAHDLCRTLTGRGLGPSTAELAQELRALEKALGLWRDCQVGLRLVRPGRRREVSGSGHRWLVEVRSRLRSDARSFGARSSKLARGVIRKSSPEDLYQVLRERSPPSGKRARSAWYPEYHRRYDSIRHALNSTKGTMSAKRVHRIRQSFRRLRLLRHLSPFEGIPPLPGRIVQLTGDLGRIHDLDRLLELTDRAPRGRGRKEVRRAIRRDRDRRMKRLAASINHQGIRAWERGAPEAWTAVNDWTVESEPSGPAMGLA